LSCLLGKLAGLSNDDRVKAFPAWAGL